MMACNITLWYQRGCHGITLQASWDNMVRCYGAVKCEVMLPNAMV